MLFLWFVSPIVFSIGFLCSSCDYREFRRLGLMSYDLLKVRLNSFSSVSIESRTFDSSTERVALTFLIDSWSSWSCIGSSSQLSSPKASGALFTPFATLIICSFDSFKSKSCFFYLISYSLIMFCCLRVIACRLSCSTEYCSISFFSFSASSYFFNSC